MYPEYKQLDLNQVAQDIRAYWKEHSIFQKSISSREGNETFTFYEGPPSANGKPGIHHVLGRAIKDIFCRYKTLKGYQVKRKGGWDTHGLPVELQVEARLGIKKEDIGKKISVAEYNAECRKDVMQFKGIWDELTERIGFWLDLDDPYVTYETNYIETVWHLLKRLFDKDLLYKGYTIQPYSPAAGTGLSSHELNQPGTYKEVKDVSCTAQFKLADEENTFLLAWTTTPWTLPSNAALAVGKNIEYLLVETINPYTESIVKVYLAKSRLAAYFKAEGEEKALTDFTKGDKVLPYRILRSVKGSELAGTRYEQLLPYVKPQEGDAFKVIIGDFVTTEDGTGIVHIAPTFGADDQRVAKQQGIAAITVADPEQPDVQMPLVDKKGRFVPEMGEFAGRYVKNYQDDPNYVDVNVDICVKLKKENRAFKVEKYEHNYPHCWRTDKPVLYYPLEAWFIKTTAFKERFSTLNDKINWKPAHTGTGRFGNWLDNLVDWNLSRTRFWGTPLPIWSNADGSVFKCIGSVDELRAEIKKAQEAGISTKSLADEVDLHRPYVDEVVLATDNGEPMHRVPDVIDVWFDSGAMPYAQWHFPFENNDVFKANFPADFIAEGVDQTRGWFFTLHAIASMLFDNVAYKNVIANGLVLDKHGNKMSKRLGNAVDPFTTMDNHGIDALRWYMVHNAQPWDNLKFDIKGVEETKRKFFGTLHNTYQFFALYANIDQFKFDEKQVPFEQKPEIDRWILSELQSLIKRVESYLDDYEPNKAIRDISTFVIDHLSNWYVRLCRRRFWKGDVSDDKRSAYQTLYTCLLEVSKLSSPFAPFYMDRLYQDLVKGSSKKSELSVHLDVYPEVQNTWIDPDLEKRMWYAREITSLGLALRRQAKLKVRQPLKSIMLPSTQEMQAHIHKVEDLLKGELNIKAVQYIDHTAGFLTKTVKPNFKKLGPKLGPKIKELKAALDHLDQDRIVEFEQSGIIEITLSDSTIKLELEDVSITSSDIPGWEVASNGEIVVALDTEVTDELRQEGLARELVNRLQNLRKSTDLEVTDHIEVQVIEDATTSAFIPEHKEYICHEILADKLELVPSLPYKGHELDLDGVQVHVSLNKV